MLRTADLEADAAILRAAYEQLHPGLYRYNTPAQMDAHFAELTRRLDHDQTLGEAFLAFSQFTATVRCGHTQVNPFNQSKAVVDALFTGSPRVPFYFVWTGTASGAGKGARMLVTRDLTPDHVLPAGSVIERLNGVGTDAVLAKLMTVARADGANDAKRIAQLGVNGAADFETFDLFYPMFFPQPAQAGGVRETLLVRTPGASRPQTVVVKALTAEARALARDARPTSSNGSAQEAARPLFTWKDLPGGSALLTMPTWALYNSKWEWKPWLAAHLDEAAARNAPALVIDLRGNEGGDDVGREIVAHLLDAPKTISPMVRLVRYRKVPETLNPYLDTWDKSFRNWGNSAVEQAEPWPTAPAGVAYLKLVREHESADGDTLAPAGKRFRGKVVVLVDANNSSATFQFAQTIREGKLGTLVGQTTGGSQRGINGGAFFFVRLPHSGLEVDLPLIGTFPPTPMPDGGITPDILVTETTKTLAAGRDAGMEAAMAAAGIGSQRRE